ncbi:uncharacterized protein EAE97_008643 [Botrytis byssoidea]|uniref:Uncharacterized protein n=1 Tax=Botrytis byssoidea TaxID=139641 RepID=A0A9P5M0N2_9HELO|nr:uncharacterized protein EAE97_008643 [Botrytis byssoidea]KAF7934283.1 hypothetical protein EAE97_008643 [Botrytis byssoidea]
MNDEVKRTYILANRPHSEVASSPSKDAIKLPPIGSILEGPTGSCTLPLIFPIVVRPSTYTQLPIRSEVFPVNQTLIGLPLVFASVEDSCKQQSTIPQSCIIRNAQDIRDRSPGEGTPGTKAAKKDGQHLVETGYQDESLKICDELEGIQERICSIIEEYEQLMKEKNPLRGRSGDIKAMPETANEMTAKEEMTEDQKYVPRAVMGNLKQDETLNYVSSLSSSDVITEIDYAYLKRIIGDGQAHILRRHLLLAGINQIWARSRGLLMVEA